MKVLILAAGEGRRLRPITVKKPKPAIKVCGVPLILRNCAILKELGLEICVVVGYKAEEIINILDKDVQVIYNGDIKKGNAYSVFCAKNLFKNEEKFLVLMGDHLYSPEFLKKAIKAPENTAIVCEQNEIIEIEEATKVFTKNGQIVDIGKTIKDWHYIDTGAFMCTGNIFEILEKLFREKKTVEWSEIVKEAGMNIYVVNEAWMDIDTIENYKTAEKILLKALIKPEDGFIAKIFNRKISLRITKYLSTYDLSPNLISFFSFFLCIVAACLFFLKSYLLGGIFAQFSSVIDGVDGEIARLKLKKSKFGGFYDALLDRYADAFLLLGLFLSLPFNLFRFFSFFFALLGTFLISYTTSKFYETYNYRAESVEKYLRLLPGKRDERIFLIFIFSSLACFHLVFIDILLFILALLTNIRVAGRLLVARSLEGVLP
ncbi:MAG: NTP transferase domain-containing protein [Candidatus Desulfofervidus auxilii]|nr:NTP transferase domain-containing protein [Candidatus Desulfofervidus auxilii]